MVAIVALLLWLLPSVVQATTYYVSTTGSNANNGTSEETPFATIAYAVDTMLAGDTTYVRGGTYSESGVRFRTTGTQASPIKLLAYPNELPILSCTASNLETNSILIRHNAGLTNPMGWITIDGLKIQNCNDGIKGENIHNSTFTHLWLLNNDNQGVLITGAHDNIFAYSIVQHSGDFANCVSCTQQHGLYLSGKRWQIHHNIFVDNLAYGVQQNGSSSANNSATVPDVEFRGAQDWVVTNNTFAYNSRRAGMVVWGSTTTNFRIENNIFYENGVTLTAGSPNGVDFVSATGVTGGSIRNNHFYASGSGAQAALGVAPPTVYTNSGNVVNVSPPAFVNGGSNALPASPDFRLTALSPVNIALANEFPSNGVVGAFQPVGAPIGTITTNKATLTFPFQTAVPIKDLSTAGVTIACTGANCPGTLTATGVSAPAGTDTIAEVSVSGFPGDACPSTNLSVTASYDSSTGTWTGNDNIGPYPSLNQNILSFTNVAIANNCTGSGPSGYPPGYHILYRFTEGTGTNVNDSSANNLDCTFTNGPTWGPGKYDTGMVVAAGSSQHCAMGWGSGVNPTTQSLTVFVPVNISAGAENAVHYVVGPDHGSNQRAYICARDGTWRVSIQAITCSSTSPSNLTVTAGWNPLTLIFDSATDTFTLYKGTTAGTGGATGLYTSFTFATNWTLGRVAGLTSTGGTYDDFIVYLSVQDPADLLAVFDPSPSSPTGTLKQAAIRFGGVVLDTAGSPIVLGSLSHGISVPKRGGAVILFEVKCNAGTDCDQTAFKLVYVKNGATTWQQVPNTETADGTWMWGHSTEADLNNGLRATSLTGSCTMQTGATLMTADQVPSLALAADTCTVLAYIVHVDGVAGVDYFDYKVRTQDNVDLAGGYDEIARIRVVNPMGGGAGY